MDDNGLAAHLAEWPDTMTLGEARRWLRKLARQGAQCPCCRQTARIYRRALNAGMAHALLVMWCAHRCEWQDKTETLRGVGPAARDESLLRFWGLLQEHEERREDGGRAGWWRVTERGALFVRGLIDVPSHLVIYAGKPQRLDESGGRITIRDALGERFSYEELMADIPEDEPAV